MAEGPPRLPRAICARHRPIWLALVNGLLASMVAIYRWHTLRLRPAATVAVMQPSVSQDVKLRPQAAAALAAPRPSRHAGDRKPDQGRAQRQHRPLGVHRPAGARHASNGLFTAAAEAAAVLTTEGQTLYTRVGDVIGWLCAGGSLLILIPRAAVRPGRR